jgi:hypothetical protein
VAIELDATHTKVSIVTAVGFKPDEKLAQASFIGPLNRIVAEQAGGVRRCR